MVSLSLSLPSREIFEADGKGNYSFEEDAEQNCEVNLALAAKVDPSDPEVYLVSSLVSLIKVSD